ncbi:MAG: DUF4007 family protein [Sarcina sp.]
MVKNTDIKLKGHGSFNLREGWLKKGFTAVEEGTFSKSKEEMIDELGVGSNMVAAVKYWLKAMGIVEDKRGIGNKPYLKFTSILGEIIHDKDPYLEDIGTIALLHYKIINNFKMATSWSILFNEFNSKEFSKRDIEEFIAQELTRMGYTKFPLASIDNDVQCILKTYLKNSDNIDDLNPEENNVCPMAELDVIGKVKQRNGQIIYEKRRIKKNKLDKLIFLYIILEKTIEKGIEGINTTIDNLLNESGNVGKVFNLDRNDINQYLDELSDGNYLRVVRTAGLNQIYFDLKELKRVDILNEYYGRNN